MKPNRRKIQETAKKHTELVEWSDEDGCCSSSAPWLVGRACDRATENGVLRPLEVIVEELIGNFLTEERPPALLGEKRFTRRFAIGISPEGHRLVAREATARRASLNRSVAEALARKGWSLRTATQRSAGCLRDPTARNICHEAEQYTPD